MYKFSKFNRMGMHRQEKMDDLSSTVELHLVVCVFGIEHTSGSVVQQNFEF